MVTDSVFEITDDDGVFVVSTKKQLVAICPPTFDYAFPGLALEGLRRGALVAWRSPFASISDVALSVHAEPQARPRRSLAGYLEVLEDDELVITTWAQLTMAMDGGGGRVAIRKGLAASVRAIAGWYAIRVDAPTQLADDPRGVELRWNVDVVPTSAPSAAELAGLDIVAFEEPP